MIKFTADIIPLGTLYGFGLTEANLNRLEFNDKPIFFDFGYAGHPDLFGLIAYMGEYNTPEDIAANIDVLRFAYLNNKQGRNVPGQMLCPGNSLITPETMHFFPLAKSIIAKFRSTPFWGFNTQIAITHASDQQVFFAGRTEQEIEQYLQGTGLIDSQTKRTSKGFKKFTQ